MYHQAFTQNSALLRADYAYVLNDSRSNQRLLSCITLTDWFFKSRRNVFTARYGLLIYIKCRLIKLNYCVTLR